MTQLPPSGAAPSDPKSAPDAGGSGFWGSLGTLVQRATAALLREQTTLSVTASNPATNAITLSSVAGLHVGQQLVLSSPGIGVPQPSVTSVPTGGNLPPAAVYEYCVTAKSAVGETLPSQRVQVPIPSGLVPPVITGLTVDTSGGGIDAGTALSYYVTAHNAVGETLPSANARITLPSAIAPPTDYTGGTNHPAFGANAGHFPPNTPVSYKITQRNDVNHVIGVITDVAAGPNRAFTISIPTASNSLGGTTGIGSLSLLKANDSVCIGGASANTNQAVTGTTCEIVTLKTYNPATGQATADFVNSHASANLQCALDNMKGESLPSAEVTYTTPKGSGGPVGTGTANHVVAQLQGAVTTTGAQSFTLVNFTSGAATDLQNGDYLFIELIGSVNVEYVQISGWNSGAATGTATFTKTHPAAAAADNATWSISAYATYVAGLPYFNVYRRWSGFNTYVWVYQGMQNPSTPVNPVSSFDGGYYTANRQPPTADTSATHANTVVVSWLSMGAGVTYSVYGRSAGSERKLGDVSGTSLRDDNSLPATGAALPTTDTTQSMHNSTTVSWAAIAGAAKYGVYGRVPGSAGFLADALPPGSGSPAYTDTGALTPGSAPPSEDRSMIADEVRTVTTIGTVSGTNPVVVGLDATPDTSRTLGVYQVGGASGPKTAGFSGLSLGVGVSALYDGISGLFAAMRASTQDSVTGHHLQEVGLGLLNQKGRFDRAHGLNGALLVTDGKTASYPQNHRLAVVSADAVPSGLPSSPTDTSNPLFPNGAVIPALGQTVLELDVTLTNPAGGAATAQLQPMFWNARTQQWSAQGTDPITLDSGPLTIQGFRLTIYRPCVCAITQISASCRVDIDAVLA
jgi:hypothetical protein